MPSPNTFLFIMPLKHHLNYSSCVMDRVIARYGSGKRIVRLVGDEANPDSIDEAIRLYDPLFVWGTGHGLQGLYTVECTQKYLWVGSPRVELFKGRIVHLNSCLTGRQLGPHLVSSGAEAFLGSMDTFYLFVGSPPCSDRASMSVFLAEHQAEVALLQGRSVGEAHRARLDAYDREIDYWVTGEGKNSPYAPLIARILEIDRMIAVLYGKGGVRATQPAYIPISLVSGIVGLGLTVIATR